MASKVLLFSWLGVAFLGALRAQLRRRQIIHEERRLKMLYRAFQRGVM